jgi:hypothetical protein
MAELYIEISSVINIGTTGHKMPVVPQYYKTGEKKNDNN